MRKTLWFFYLSIVCVRCVNGYWNSKSTFWIWKSNLWKFFFNFLSSFWLNFLTWSLKSFNFSNSDVTQSDVFSKVLFQRNVIIYNCSFQLSPLLLLLFYFASRIKQQMNEKKTIVTFLPSFTSKKNWPWLNSKFWKKKLLTLTFLFQLFTDQWSFLDSQLTLIKQRINETRKE